MTTNEVCLKVCLYDDDPQARRRQNHNMVEWGDHIVPTLRNRVLIFLYFSFFIIYYYYVFISLFITFLPEGGCPKVLKFCILVTKILGFGDPCIMHFLVGQGGEGY